MENFKKSGMFSVIAALGANILVAISKFVGYAISGSAAMLNESIHSIVDCSNQILLLLGINERIEGKANYTNLAKEEQNIFLAQLWQPCSFLVGELWESWKLLKN